MRTVFNIEIKTDIPAHDEERRKALIELFMRTSRTLFTQTTMLAKGVSPTINITSEDNVNGTEVHPLFGEKEETNQQSG